MHVFGATVHVASSLKKANYQSRTSAQTKKNWFFGLLNKGLLKLQKLHGYCHWKRRPRKSNYIENKSTNFPIEEKFQTQI